MNHLGMLIDVSHLSEEGFYSVIEVSKTCCSHPFKCVVNPTAPRNLRDEQIKLLCKNRGHNGYKLLSAVLVSQQAGLNDIISHIEYIAGLAGTDVIGFGWILTALMKP